MQFIVVYELLFPQYLLQLADKTCFLRDTHYGKPIGSEFENRFISGKVTWACSYFNELSLAPGPLGSVAKGLSPSTMIDRPFIH